MASAVPRFPRSDRLVIVIATVRLRRFLRHALIVSLRRLLCSQGYRLNFGVDVAAGENFGADVAALDIAGP